MTIGNENALMDPGSSIDKNPWRDRFAVTSSGTALFFTGIVALISGVVIFMGLMNGPLPFGFSAGWIFLTGLLFHFLYPVFHREESRRKYAGLLSLCFLNWAVVSGSFLFGMQGEFYFLLCSMAILTVIIAISSGLALVYAENATGVVLERNTATVSVFVVAAIEQCLINPAMWSSSGLWGGAHLYLWSGIFGSLMVGGAVLLVSLLVVLSLTGFMVIMNGVKTH
jgi:hypothetical protein